MGAMAFGAGLVGFGSGVAAGLGLSMNALAAASPPPPLVDARKRIWLLLCTEGGWWTEEEIRQNLHLHKKVHSALGEMVRDKFLSRQRSKGLDGEQLVRYGVDAKCKFPRGVVWGDVQELLLMAVRNRKQ